MAKHIIEITERVHDDWNAFGMHRTTYVRATDKTLPKLLSKAEEFAKRVRGGTVHVNSTPDAVKFAEKLAARKGGFSTL